MKNISTLFVLLALLTSCKNNKKSDTKSNDDAKVKDFQELASHEVGNKLMEQKCFICHFPTPNPDKKDQMIAPPMIRIQEHYKPAYPTKEAFIKAIKKWVNKPSEDKVQMPGSVRKFKIMPYLAYSDKDITRIAEALYDFDFGKVPKANSEKQSLELNNGKKWKLDKGIIDKIKGINNKITLNKVSNTEEYHELGKEIFNTAKTVLLNLPYEDENKKITQQLQAFFHNIEEDMHQLMQVNSLNEGENTMKKLKKKFKNFDDYFEQKDSTN